MTLTNHFNSAAKSKTRIAVYTASNSHRVSFLSSIHGYVAGRKWYSVFGIVYIQSTRSQKWIPYDNQYKLAVDEALETVSNRNCTVDCKLNAATSMVRISYIKQGKLLGSKLMTRKQYLGLLAEMHNNKLLTPLPDDLVVNNNN